MDMSLLKPKEATAKPATKPAPKEVSKTPDRWYVETLCEEIVIVLNNLVEKHRRLSERNVPRAKYLFYDGKFTYSETDTFEGNDYPKITLEQAFNSFKIELPKIPFDSVKFKVFGPKTQLSNIAIGKFYFDVDKIWRRVNVPEGYKNTFASVDLHEKHETVQARSDREVIPLEIV